MRKSIETRTSDEYTLTEAENTEIFEEKIVPDLLANVPSQLDTPLLTIVMAQHGAGKTYLAKNRIMPKLDSLGGFVNIDSDLYKPYHPAYADLMAQDDKEAARHTGADGQRWMRQALNYARENRQHTLVQETVQNPPFLVDMVNTYKDSEFKINITALGVAEEIARQSMLKRYLKQREQTGSGRLPPPEKVEASINGVLDFAGIIDDQRMADEVRVYRRGNPVPTYENNLVDGEWQGQPEFKEAIIRERFRELDEEESIAFLNTHQYIVERLQDDPEIQLQLIAVGALASKFMKLTA